MLYLMCTRCFPSHFLEVYPCVLGTNTVASNIGISPSVNYDSAWFPRHIRRLHCTTLKQAFDWLLHSHRDHPHIDPTILLFPPHFRLSSLPYCSSNPLACLFGQRLCHLDPHPESYSYHLWHRVVPHSFEIRPWLEQVDPRPLYLHLDSFLYFPRWLCLEILSAFPLGLCYPPLSPPKCHQVMVPCCRSKFERECFPSTPGFVISPQNG
mmetsp:Transcript_39432/g.95414  ORF Transcript_39432/g.95414 Transcript_39432/m.95414 type:complete len:209 (-) Transcript_39432:1073-1699(-)